jgi:hypothetical protein
MNLATEFSEFLPGRCKECMEQWEGQNGAYIVKNKTACGTGVKTKDVTAFNIKNCVDAGAPKP